MNDTLTDIKTSLDIDFPSLWGVRFLNDDYTPIEFVIAVLMEHFSQNEQEATAITIKVHEEGEAVVGTYTKDVALTKVRDALHVARASGHPLRLDAVEI